MTKYFKKLFYRKNIEQFAIYILPQWKLFTHA